MVSEGVSLHGPSPSSVSSATPTTQSSGVCLRDVTNVRSDVSVGADSASIDQLMEKFKSGFEVRLING